MLRPEAVSSLGRLGPDDFANFRHRATFEAIGSLVGRGNPVDILTLQAELDKRGQLEAIGGLAALATYLGKVPTADNVTYYAALIRDHAFHRRLQLATATASERLGLDTDWRSVLDGLKGTLDALESESQSAPTTLRQAVAKEIASIAAGDADVVGLPSGLGIERICPTGIPIGYVTTLFGESGSFKSTLVNNIAWNIAAAGSKVLHVSWEDSTKLTAQRFIARHTGVGYGRIAARQLDPHDRLVMAVPPEADELASRVIMADDIEANMDAVIQAARHHKRTDGISVVVVDYLQIMDYEVRHARHEAISDAVKKAQRSAARDKLAYVLVSQVKTDIGERDDPRPHMEDCFGSGAIRMFSKLGLGVFRPWKHCQVPVAKTTARTRIYYDYHVMAQAWRYGPEDFIANVYPRIIELCIDKSVFGEAPVTIHMLADPPTGKLEPFKAR